jgi:cephalosporin hydroxylase
MRQSFNMVEEFIQALKKEEPSSGNNEIALRNYLSKMGNEFMQMFYYSKMWSLSKYKGIVTYKYPNDLWILQEIISEIKPDVFIETGTFNGGTSLFVADLMDWYGKGMVVTVDIERQENLPQHDRIVYLTGDSVSDEVLSWVEPYVNAKPTVMVDLDSYHTKDHVSKELELYSPFVTEGSYLIVEDTLISGHPVQVKNGDGKNVDPGPYEAVMEFLKGNDNFKIDRSRTRFLITTNPDGYLRRVA